MSDHMSCLWDMFLLQDMSAPIFHLQKMSSPPERLVLLCHSFLVKCVLVCLHQKIAPTMSPFHWMFAIMSRIHKMSAHTCLSSRRCLLLCLSSSEMYALIQHMSVSMFHLQYMSASLCIHQEMSASMFLLLRYV